MTNSKWMALALVAALAGGVTSVALAGEGKGERRGRDSGAGRLGGLRDRFRHRLRERFAERRAEAPKFLASLDVTDDQRRLVLERARSAAPILASAKDEARRIIARAWAAAGTDGTLDREALRESVRTELKALKEKTRAHLDPLAKDVVGSITPEQRKKFEERAAKHGRTLDDAKLSKFAARLIARPMTAAFLEARLGR